MEKSVTFTIVAYVFSDALDSWECVTIKSNTYAIMRQSLRMIRYAWEDHSIRIIHNVDGKNSVIYEDKDFCTFAVCMAVKKIFNK